GICAAAALRSKVASVIAEIGTSAAASARNCRRSNGTLAKAHSHIAFLPDAPGRNCGTMRAFVSLRKVAPASDRRAGVTPRRMEGRKRKALVSTAWSGEPRSPERRFGVVRE